MMKKKKTLTRSENMARIKAVNTNIERILRAEVWKRGLRYRKNDTGVIGKPDLVFKKMKIAIFCDSEFWHGKKYKKGEVPKTNRTFWIRKFMANIQRDREVNRALRSDGWYVIRFWENEIVINPKKCANKIEAVIKRRRTQ